MLFPAFSALVVRAPLSNDSGTVRRTMPVLVLIGNHSAVSASCVGGPVTSSDTIRNQFLIDAL